LEKVLEEGVIETIPSRGRQSPMMRRFLQNNHDESIP